MRHCRKPRWWKPVPAKEEEVWRILELIEQVTREKKQGEGQERDKGKFQPHASNEAIGKSSAAT
jgi:hypothetical protein